MSYYLDLQIGSKRTQSPFVIFNKENTYGTHYSHFGVGGYVELPTLDYRNSIPTELSIGTDGFSSGRRKFGMIVYVISENKYYQLIPVENGQLVSLDRWLFLRPAKKLVLLNPELQNIDDFDDGTVADENGDFDWASFDSISGTGNPNDCWVEVFVKGNFQTLADLEFYIENNKSAYAGQICSVIENKKVYLVINGATAGVLDLQEIGAGGGGGEIFEDDFEVSIAAGKTFGKYANGDLVLAKNKTPKEVILMACLEALNPDLNIFTSDTIEFGYSGSKTLEIQFGYTIRTKNAIVSSIKLEKKIGPLSSWDNSSEVVTLLDWSSSAIPSTDAPSSPFYDTFDHVKYDTTSLYYRLTVADSGGGTNSTVYTFTPNPYLAPSISSNSIGTVSRYRGDSDTTYTGTINKRSNLVPIMSYKLQRRINSGSWSDLISYNVSNNPSSIAIPSTAIETDPANNDVKNANSLTYQIVVIDEYTQSISSQTELGALTINFYHRCGTIYSSKTSLDITDVDDASIVGTGSHGMILQDAKARSISPIKPGSGNYLYYVYKASLYPPKLKVVENGVTLLSSAFSGGDGNPNAPQFLNNVTNKHGATVSYVVHRSSAVNAFGNAPGTSGTSLAFSNA